MARDFARIERYEALRSRVRDLVERRFHHNRAPATDLDELERTIDRLEALVSVEPGQAVPPPVKAEAAPPRPPAEKKPATAKAAAAAKPAKKAPKRGTRPKAPVPAPKPATTEASAACAG